MAKPAGALTDAALSVGRLARTAGAVSVRLYVEYDVARVGRIRPPLNALELIEPESVSDPPRDHVVGTGGVTADADATDFDPILIEREAATEDVYAADAPANHGIVWRAEGRATRRTFVEAGLANPVVFGRTVAISDCRVDRVAVLQAVKAAARLHG